MIRKLLMGLLICLMTAAFTGEALAKTEASAKAKLDTFVTEYVKKANKRMSVNRKKPQVEKRGTVYVARFTEIDEKTAFAEMRKSKSKQAIHHRYPPQKGLKSSREQGANSLTPRPVTTFTSTVPGIMNPGSVFYH